ncbi:polyadenylated RNA-binding protein NAB2 [Ceratobasidium sp. AG-Ba]|nr:polyadenylated RNA-binding protein NAB2 [Ceratobasidium sp. AG-Ba]
MGSELVMGTPEAGALQSAIQKELVTKGYSDESGTYNAVLDLRDANIYVDMVMAEYITIMLINSKTAEQITSELVDLVGPEYDTSFTSWLFDEVAKISGSTGASSDPKPVIQPDAQPRNASANPRILNQALNEAKAAASPPQKRRADGRSPSPASKARRTTDLPDRPRAMRDGPSNNEPQPVRSLLDRVEPPRRHGGFDHVQAQIDAVTRGGGPHGGGRVMGRGGMGMNGHHHQQQQPQQQMMMNQMMGGVNPMMFQEMMANQMAIMSQMAANLGMLPGNQQMLGQGGPGFNGFPNGHGQGPNANGRGRGGHRGGRGGNMGDRPPNGPPPQQSPPQQQASQLTAPQPRPPQPPVPVNVPTRPQSPTLCKFGMKCTNASCRYSHPSAEGGLVLSSEYCEKGLECKDADCTKGHPSPAAINGVPVVAQAPPAARPAPPAGGFHKSGKPCRFGINCTRADCSFDHPPGRVLPGASLATQKPSHKSMTFRAPAASTSTMESGPVSKKFGPGGAVATNVNGGAGTKPENENAGDEDDVEAALAAA